MKNNTQQPIYKRWYFWVCGFILLSIVFMLSFYFYSGFQYKEAENNRKKWADNLKTMEYHEVDYNYLFNNTKEYVHKNVLTAIKITDVERISDGRVKADTEEHQGIAYDFDFVFDDVNEPMMYNSGDYVTIVGKVRGKDSSLGTVTLEQCHIVEVGKASIDKMLELENK